MPAFAPVADIGILEHDRALALQLLQIREQIKRLRVGLGFDVVVAADDIAGVFSPFGKAAAYRFVSVSLSREWLRIVL